MSGEEIERQRDEALASRNRYATLCDLAPVALLLIDTHARILDANATGWRLLGLHHRYRYDADLMLYLEWASATKLRAALSRGVATTMEVRVQPLRGNGFVAIDAALVSTFVDFFFGGAGGTRRPGGPRELTQGEQRVVQIALREALSAFTAAWAPVTQLELEIAGHAANLQYATLHASRDLVCTSRLHVTFDGGEGELRFVLPYATVEPVRHLLDGSPKSEHVEGDERWSANLRDDLLDAEIELSSNLVETQIRIGDFLKLRPGDVIPVDLPELVTLGADEIPLFHARFGTAGGNNAVRLVEPVRPKGFGAREASNEVEITNPKSKVSNTRH